MVVEQRGDCFLLLLDAIQVAVLSRFDGEPPVSDGALLATRTSVANTAILKSILGQHFVRVSHYFDADTRLCILQMLSAARSPEDLCDGLRTWSMCWTAIDRCGVTQERAPQPAVSAAVDRTIHAPMDVRIARAVNRIHVDLSHRLSVVELARDAGSVFSNGTTSSRPCRASKFVDLERTTMRRSIGSLSQTLLMLLSVAHLASAQSLDARREKILAADMDVTNVTPPRGVTVAGVTVPTAPQQVRAVRVRLRLVNAGTAPATIVIEDAQGKEIERVDTSTFVAGEYWSREVPGGSARVRLVATQPNLEVTADQFATPIVGAKPQAIVGIDDSRPITDATVPPRVKLWAPSIARLKFIAGGIPRVCTGFLLGRDLLMTNQHCISTPAEAATAVAEFGFDTAAAVPVSFRVVKIEAVDTRLDYSLVRLAGDASKFGRLFLGPAAASQMKLIVVQHPQGLPKKAAFPPNCSVGSTSVAGVDDVLNDFGHVCDTLVGSSGSPVVESTDGTVVGLHHWRWPDGAAIPENQAVHIGLIVKDLTARVHDGSLGKAVLDEVTRPRPQP